MIEVEFMIPGRSPLTNHRHTKCKWILPNVQTERAAIDVAQLLEEIARISWARLDAGE